MQLPTLKALASAMLSLALGYQLVLANETNPYAAIVDRNPFGLKPPPPPPPSPESTAPPVPMAKVVLTGLLSTFGEPRALFEIVEEPGKSGGTPKKPILREGERLGPVEVLAIDVVKNSVLIRNSGVETNVTFEVAKAGPAAGGPGVPGMAPAFAPPPVTPPPAVNTTMNQPASSGPTIISGNSAGDGGGGVTLMGGASSVTTASASSFGAPGALGAPSGSLHGMPSRPLRTGVDSAGAPNAMPALTRDQAALLMEVQRLKGGPPAPPTHLTPLMDAAGQEGNVPPTPFPQFPPSPQKRR